ncbi:uncharacterized protein LOC127396385 [Apus apus]|uniref:uncharacterized protein LOC127396385 n=1 Tax=Apus apus TaxID=8895 RepID=UPI0021F91C91|nr:uncharacterized protein LOC127396385 [Apus apus]
MRGIIIIVSCCLWNIQGFQYMTVTVHQSYPVKLWINVTEKSTPQTTVFDACQILNCGPLESQRQWRHVDKYLCPESGVAVGKPCGQWSSLWFMAAQGWTAPHSQGNPLKKQLRMFKGTSDPSCQHLQCNPVIISLTKVDKEVNCTYGLGAEITGTDPVGRFRIVVWESKLESEKARPTVFPKIKTWNPPNDPKVVTLTEVKDIKQTFEIEIGYGETNVWVEWVKYTVQSLNQSNCYACASGRPTARIVPFPLGWSKDPQGIKCMIALYQDTTAWGDQACKSLSLLFPAVQIKDLRVPPAFSVVLGVGNCSFLPHISLNKMPFKPAKISPDYPQLRD